MRIVIALLVTYLMIPAAGAAELVRCEPGTTDPLGAVQVHRVGRDAALWSREVCALGRRHRGDWEPPDLVLVQYVAIWEQTLAPLVRAVGDEARVLIGLPDARAHADAAAWIADADLEDADLSLLDLPADTPWVRDYGPFQAFDPGGALVWLDANYGTARPHDDVVPLELGAVAGVPVESLHELLDGGAFISNGTGLCATTGEGFADTCVEPQSADRFLEEMGCDTLALLPALHDDEAKHVDMFAQFTAPDTVAVAAMDPALWPEDAARLDEAADALSAAAYLRGRELRVVRVPMQREGDTYFTYVNGLRLDTRFLAPSYAEVSDLEEEAAYAALQQAMPGTDIVPIAADALVHLHGALHCMALGLDLPERDCTDDDPLASGGTR